MDVYNSPLRALLLLAIWSQLCLSIGAMQIEQVNEYDDLYLRCGYDYLPNSNQQLIWRKENQVIAMIVHGALSIHDPLYEQRIVQHDRDALKVLRPTIVDTGRYSCSIEVQHSIVDSKVLYSNSAIVFVYGGPHLNTSSDEVQTASARSSVQLSCSCSSWPQAEIHWEQLNTYRVLQRRQNLSMPNDSFSWLETEMLGSEFVQRRWTKNSSEVTEKVNYLAKVTAENQKLTATAVHSVARLPVTDEQPEVFRCVCKSLQQGDSSRLRTAFASKVFAVYAERSADASSALAEFDTLTIKVPSPRNLSASRNGNIINLSWLPPLGHSKVDHYILQYRIGDTRSTSNNINGNKTDYRFYAQHFGLYSFRIFAILPNARSAYSEEVQILVTAQEAKWEGLAVTDTPWYLVIIVLVLLVVVVLTVLVVRQVMKMHSNRTKDSGKKSANLAANTNQQQSLANAEYPLLLQPRVRQPQRTADVREQRANGCLPTQGARVPGRVAQLRCAQQCAAATALHSVSTVPTNSSAGIDVSDRNPLSARRTRRGHEQFGNDCTNAVRSPPHGTDSSAWRGFRGGVSRTGLQVAGPTCREAENRWRPDAVGRTAEAANRHDPTAGQSHVQGRDVAQRSVSVDRSQKCPAGSYGLNLNLNVCAFNAPCGHQQCMRTAQYQCQYQCQYQPNTDSSLSPRLLNHMKRHGDCVCATLIKIATSHRRKGANQRHTRRSETDGQVARCDVVWPQSQSPLAKIRMITSANAQSRSAGALRRSRCASNPLLYHPAVTHKCSPLETAKHSLLAAFLTGDQTCLIQNGCLKPPPPWTFSDASSRDTSWLLSPTNNATCNTSFDDVPCSHAKTDPFPITSNWRQAAAPPTKPHEMLRSQSSCAFRYEARTPNDHPLSMRISDTNQQSPAAVQMAQRLANANTPFSGAPTLKSSCSHSQQLDWTIQPAKAVTNQLNGFNNRNAAWQTRLPNNANIDKLSKMRHHRAADRSAAPIFNAHYQLALCNSVPDRTAQNLSAIQLPHDNQSHAIAVNRNLFASAALTRQVNVSAVNAQEKSALHQIALPKWKNAGNDHVTFSSRMPPNPSTNALLEHPTFTSVLPVVSRSYTLEHFLCSELL